MKKHTETSILRRIITIIFALPFVIIISASVKFLFFGTDDRIQGEDLSEDFTKYEGEIYFLDEYRIPEADVTSFRPISDQIDHVALDKNHVYCGNRILPNLDPDKTNPISHAYYTDNNLTYYCYGRTAPNDSLSVWDGFWNVIEVELFNADKKPTSTFPFALLPSSDTPYYIVPNEVRPIATNGDLVYYADRIMKDANPDTLVELDRFGEYKKRRKSYFYSTDGESVYYEDKKLSVPYNDKMYSFELSAQNTKEFIINPVNGMIYVEDISFDENNAPYKIVSKYSDHVNHALFLSKNGVYFYNYRKRSIERAGDNFFLNKNYIEIAPLVFSDSTKTLFIDDITLRSKKGGVISRSTIIGELEENLKSDWVTLGSIQTGTIWINGDSYFYFDKYGESQKIDHTIYRIKNKQVAEYLLQNKVSLNNIQQLIETEELKPVKYKNLLEAKTNHNSGFPYYE